jgi:hypothetical protein
MSTSEGRRVVVVLSSSWNRQNAELAFVTREVAGALSRSCTVIVVTQGPACVTEPDGAFDVVGLGSSGSRWPNPASTTWNQQPDPAAVWIVDDPSADARALLRAFGNVSTAFSIAVSGSPDGALRELPLTSARVSTGDVLGINVPINPLAAAHRHIGLGFTGYVLVLTDRRAAPPVDPPTPAAAWLTSRFYDQHVVVLEGGRAAAWKGRALRGVIGVDTRTDLWRLMAHAKVTVDLAPGEIIARECVESLRLGTPIVAPDGTVGAEHARAGGLVFGSMADLLHAVDRLADGSYRDNLAQRGRAYADLRFGDPTTFTEKLAGLVTSAR